MKKYLVMLVVSSKCSTFVGILNTGLNTGLIYEQ